MILSILIKILIIFILYITIIFIYCFYFIRQVFHVVNFEAYYTNHTEQLSKGVIVPTQNVALAEKSACVIEGVSRYVKFCLPYILKEYICIYFFQLDHVIIYSMET